MCILVFFVFVFKQKTAYEMRISDWSSDVCSSDLGLSMSDGIRCMWMRGGTSKGGFFLKQDLPADSGERDALLLRVMGSPDARQIDGMGGADPLTSKVAVVSQSAREGIDFAYLFQIGITNI